MNISLKLSVVAEILPQAKYLEAKLSWRQIDEIKKKTFDESESITLDLLNLDLANCVSLEKILVEKNYNAKTISSLRNWIKNISNPKDAVITSLNMLEKTLTSIIKESKHKWILMVNPDGMLVPFAVNSIKFWSRNRDDEASVHVSLKYISIQPESHYSSDTKELKKKNNSKTVHFYKSDLSNVSDELFNSLISYEGDDDSEDEEDDDKPKKKAKAKSPKSDKKNESYLLSKILAEKGLMFMEDDYKETYETDISKTIHVAKAIGGVFTCDSMGYVIPEGKNGYSSWKSLNQENKISKLVVDEVKPESITYSMKTDSFADVEIPEHPYVLTYDLTAFKYAVVHVNNMKPYVYNPKIIEKLVISDAKKRILSSLMGSKNNFEDLIAGKSGGIVILSTGGAGLGKTLTAEVYSEVMKKPLYCVQSSQLGITVGEIEQNLNRVLYRAEKWDAVLLIDEADSYIYERGNDILQNCIVGTFLRLMEYYNGILFLTSNRPEIIDDAIMSRVTIHIKYQLPTYEESIKLWNILSENFKMTIKDFEIVKIWNKYEPFSGRDIRNTLKDISKCFPNKKEVSVDMIDELEEFLPFIKRK